MIDRYIHTIHTTNDYFKDEFNEIEKKFNQLNSKINKLDYNTICAEQENKKEIYENINKIEFEINSKIDDIITYIDDKSLIDEKAKKQEKLNKLIFISRFI
jgi:UDP-N-acetylmuramate-alanine ligase